MANILLLTQFFYPETNAGSNRISSMTGVLSKRHSVVVVTLHPNYPSPELYEDYDSRTDDSYFNFKIIRAGRFHPHIKSFMLRALAEIRMALQLAASALRESADIIIVTTPSMFLGPVGWFLSRLKSAVLIWDLRDITWRYVRESGSSDSRNLLWVADILEIVMNWFLKKADLVTCATEGIAKQSAYISPQNRFVLLPNGIDGSFLDSFGNNDVVSKQGKPVVTYAGLVGYNQGLRVLVEVASRLPAIDFYVVGDGPELEMIKIWAGEKGVQNIKFFGYLDRDAVLAIYKISTILFAQLKDTPTLNSTGNPSKLLEYMAVGKPIIYAGKGLAVDFLTSVGCAVTVSPGDSDAIAEAVQMLVNDPQSIKRMGNNGRNFVRSKYQREQLFEQFLIELESRFNLSNLH